VFRQLGGRHGISLGLLLLVIAIVVVARLLPHATSEPLINTGLGPDVAVTSATAPATQSPVTLPTPAQSTAPLLHSPVAPVTKPGSSTPQAVAKAFALAWLHHDGVSAAAWLRAVTRYTTSALASQFAETNPANVPANRITQAVTLIDDAADTCQAQVPMDTGTLALTMLTVNGRWLVDKVDWMSR